MANIRRPKPYNLPERDVTPESVYWQRRQVLKAMGFAGMGALAASLPAMPARAAQLTFEETLRRPAPLDVERNPAFQVSRAMTPADVAGRYNNFYEFSTGKQDIWRLAQNLTVEPWQVEVSGEVSKPRTYDVDDLIRRMPVEERVYRLRCVEAWSMVVPWSGFPLSALLKEVEPTSEARYVRFTTFLRPDEAERQGKKSWFGPSEPFPYTEGLTMDEAMNELTLMAVGIYGRRLPNQHGAPIRLITPWKYGFKSGKSIVKIELVREQPDTFWNTLVPSEYGFFANVNPNVPHPRWSQADERDIGTGNRIPTQLLNGYEAYVGELYPDIPRA